MSSSGSQRDYYGIAPLFPITSMRHPQESVGELWEQEGNIIVINKGFFGVTLILNDIVNHLIETRVIKKSTSTKEIFEETKSFLDPIVHFFKEIDEGQVNDLKKAYGTSGDTKYWRTLQVVLRKDFQEVHFEGLDEYLMKEEKENNETAFKYIREIENYFKHDISLKLDNEYGKAWFKKGVPEKIYSEASALAAKKNREIENEEEEKQPWDQLHLIDYREIVLKNWQKVFEQFYTRPGEEKIAGGKDAKTSWMVELNRIRNENFHTYYVTGEELSFIEEIYDWLVNK